MQCARRSGCASCTVKHRFSFHSAPLSSAGPCKASQQGNADSAARACTYVERGCRRRHRPRAAQASTKVHYRSCRHQHPQGRFRQVSTRRGAPEFYGTCVRCTNPEICMWYHVMCMCMCTCVVPMRTRGVICCGSVSKWFPRIHIEKKIELNLMIILSRVRA